MIIGRKDGDIVLFDDMPGLEIRPGHPYSKLPGLVAAGDNAAIVIAENDHGLVPEIGPEDPFTGAIETVTVDNGFHAINYVLHTLRPPRSKIPIPTGPHR